MEDCCAVCAEPLMWVAYGQCGHKEACSKCVTRLRFVMKDNRCVICQQQLLAVFVTRFMGDYTKALGPTDFEQLQAGGRQAAVLFLRAAEAYFDDKTHFDEMRKLCSYTHPALAEGQADLDSLPKFRNLKELKRHLQNELSLNFCDICLEARKVFISEQVLYSKADLMRHNQVGDVEGAMAESGFKGHPMCRFCKKRFFGENELWHHMERDHERCHLCKRAHPDRFVYFKDYAELEDHFRHEHFLCGHPSCMEKKFVVFVSEQELKQHNAKQHGGNMSRAERRQALTIPVNIQYRREDGNDGQGQSVRGGGGRSRTPGFRLREPDPQQVATAVQASLDSAARENSHRDAPSSRQAGGSAAGEGRVLDEGDFPAMGPAGPAPFVPSGYGAAATGGNMPRPEEFPALPGTTKAAKRRAKEKEKAAQSLAERLGRPGGIRVLNQGADTAGSSSASIAGREAFPSLGQSASAPNLASSRHASPAPVGAQWQASRAPGISPARLSRAPAAADFPALQTRQAPAVSPMSPPLPVRAGMQSIVKGGNTRQTASLEKEFPALGPQEKTANGGGEGHLGEMPGAANGGISEGLKAANKALIDKVKLQLDADSFTAFRQEAGRYMRSELSAEDYHSKVVGLGLASLVPEMAVLLHVAAKRAELLAVHEQAFSSNEPQSSGRWVPPEVAAAAVGAARKLSSWQCASCTLINGPEASRCEACGSGRPGEDLADWGSASASTGEQQAEGLPKEAPKKKKLPRFERMRITSGGTDKAMTEQLERQKTKPGNVWTQRHSLLPSAPAAPAVPNAWGNKGVAQQAKGVMKAWEKN